MAKRVAGPLNDSLVTEKRKAYPFQAPASLYSVFRDGWQHKLL